MAAEAHAGTTMPLEWIAERLAMRVYGHVRDQHSVAMARQVSFFTRANIAE